MKPRPLWRCPKCAKYFVTRNVWHACARHTVDEHFVRCDPKLKPLFDGVVGLLKRCGPVRVVPGKSRIAFQVRMRFAGIVVRKNRLEAAFLLPRRLDHERIKKVVAHSPRAYAHYAELRTPADLDQELAGWLRESYRVGQQADQLAGRRVSSERLGKFDWSEPFFPKKTAHSDQPAWSVSSQAKREKPGKPLWKCPKCGRTFAVRGQMHICSHLRLREALAEKSPASVKLFRRLASMVRRCGPAIIVPQKTRIAFQAQRSFPGVRFLRDAIECEFALGRRIEHPRFRQILSVSPRNHYHYLRISSEGELDGEVRAWLREAFQTGKRYHLLAQANSVRREWSPHATRSN